MEKEYDFVVLGGGSAGYAGARTAAALGKRVAVIDGGDPLGGLCILRGCMPSKTLIYSAEVLHLAQQGSLFGLDIPKAEVDMKALHQRKRATIAEFAEHRQSQLTSGDYDLYRAYSHFVDAHTVELSDGNRLKGHSFLISTGSAINWPEVPGLDPKSCWTSDDVLELDFVPESVAVLGGGVVACELAQFLRRMGAEVVQIQRSPRLLKECTAESAAVIEGAFRHEGIDLFTDTQLKQIEHHQDGSHEVHFQHQGQDVTRSVKHVFNALGRKPATEGVGLEAAGVNTLRSGHVETNAFQQSCQPHIYAAGDCAGPFEIVHVAILQGECAAQHAVGAQAAPVNFDHLTRIIFTDPQIAYVGLEEDEMRKRGYEPQSEDMPFDDHGKSILMEAKRGYVKCWADPKSRKLLAAECVGKDASELIHSMAVALPMEATLDQLLKVHWYHPTLAEIWTYPIEDLLECLPS